MAWTKNLGRVKGETGDVYIPLVELRDGYLHFTWKSHDTNEIVTEQSVPIPVYVPKKYENGEITFTATSPVIDPTTNTQEASEFTYNIKGDSGLPGPVHFNVSVISGSVYDIEDPQENTFYISGKKVWIYNNDDFIVMEQFDFENYYTINETYSMAEMDDMLRDITNQVDLAQKLYDIDEIFNE